MINTKSVVAYVLAIVSFVMGLLVLNSDLSGYAVLAITISIVLLIAGIHFSLSNRNSAKAYQNTLKQILNTYDSILVKSNGVPKLDGRNIIEVTSMDDLVDAQLEIRKPICYIKQTESCSFVLLDDKEAYLYTLKLNEDTVSPVEIEIKNLEIKNKNAEEMDSAMLKNIEKTTIIKLSNSKSYKVSPIRKEGATQQEEIEII